MQARNKAETSSRVTVTLEESTRNKTETSRTVTVTLEESTRNEPEISRVTETLEESTTNKPETSRGDTDETLEESTTNKPKPSFEVVLGEAIAMNRDAAVINFYACISMNSATGVRISGLETDDKIRIDSIQSDGSFEDSSRDRPVQQGFITITQGRLLTGGTLLDANRAEAVYVASEEKTKELLKKVGPVVKKKRRDGNGLDRGTFDYAKEEGGIIVCPPEARGPVYSNGNTQLKDGAKKDGRKVEFYSNRIKDLNCFFPCFGVQGNKQETVIKEDGTLSILAFDKEDAFRDNAGCYVVQGRIFKRN